MAERGASARRVDARKRGRKEANFTADDPTMDKKQVISLHPAGDEELHLLASKNQTIGLILCCTCGTLTPTNDANMCVKCLSLETDITQELPSRATIIHCPDCDSYLQPPTSWVKAQVESKELLTICLKRLKKLTTLRLVDAKFLFTESHSKRIKLQLRVQKEVCNQLYVEKSHIIEYVVLYRKCPSCCIPAADDPSSSNHWEAVVQVRQYVSHMKTFFFLEQLIIKHQASALAVKIEQKHHGLDFFFAKKRDAVKFYDFLCKVVPIKHQKKKNKQLVSQDIKSNISRYRYNIAAVICPICHDDLIYLPPKLYSSSYGRFGPLVICTKVRNTVTLLDPSTLKEYVLSVDQYWRSPFEPLLTSRQLVEYIVLDVSSEKTDNTCLKYVPAEVQLARVSDFGRNDTMFTARTHLGHILKPGDYALGYDLNGANFSNSEAEECRACLPDVVLIKKKSDKKQRHNRKLGSLNYMETDDSNRGGKQERSSNSEYKQFLRDLEVNPELRFNISLHQENANESSQMIYRPSTETDAEDMVSFSELENVFADLDLSDDEDGCVTE